MPLRHSARQHLFNRHLNVYKNRFSFPFSDKCSTSVGMQRNYGVYSDGVDSVIRVNVDRHMLTSNGFCIPLQAFRNTNLL